MENLVNYLINDVPMSKSMTLIGELQKFYDSGLTLRNLNKALLFVFSESGRKNILRAVNEVKSIGEGIYSIGIEVTTDEYSGQIYPWVEEMLLVPRAIFFPSKELDEWYEKCNNRIICQSAKEIDASKVNAESVYESMKQDLLNMIREEIPRSVKEGTIEQAARMYNVTMKWVT